MGMGCRNPDGAYCLCETRVHGSAMRRPIREGEYCRDPIDLVEERRLVDWGSDGTRKLGTNKEQRTSITTKRTAPFFM